MDLERELVRLFERYPSAIARDLQVSLRRVLLGGALAPKVAAPTLMAVASAVRDGAIAEVAARWMKHLDFDEPQIGEAREAQAHFAMVNAYFSFREAVDQPGYEPSKLTMAAAARPLLGKHTFERMGLALSVLNKCAPCIRFHEAKLRELGSSVDEIHDLARLAAVVKGCDALP